MTEEKLMLKTPEPWPTRLTGRELRLRAARRQRRRTALSAAGLVAGISLAVAIGEGLLGNDGVSGANTTQAATQTGGSRVDFFGASVELPAGWSLAPLDPTASEHRACVVDPTTESTSAAACQLPLAVSVDPANALDEISHPLAVFEDNHCQPGDPRFVTVEYVTVNGHSAAHFELRCTEESVPTSIWELDNRTVWLIAQGVDARSHARGIFESLTIPQSWPASERSFATASPAGCNAIPTPARAASSGASPTVTSSACPTASSASPTSPGGSPTPSPSASPSTSPSRTTPHPTTASPTSP